MSHFFAYLSKMRFVTRWGLMRNTYVENLLEHSLQVGLVAHALGVIRNTQFGGSADPERAAVLALFHDAGEVITGDIVSPIKHFNPKVRQAHAEIEEVARQRLHGMLPDTLREAYEPLLFPQDDEQESWDLVHAADKLCAYLKCLEELRAGNEDFTKAAQALEKSVRALPQPEVAYFLEHFVESFSKTLDELN
jgi:5'-deoxynucleotidase